MKKTRSAYTLIEILIATILMATLMSAIYGLFGLYASFLDAGRSQVQRQQLVRSVTQLFESDLRQLPQLGGVSTDFPPAEPRYETSGIVEVDDRDEFGITRLPVLGMIGTADSIRLVLHAPPQPSQDRSPPSAGESSGTAMADFESAQNRDLPTGVTGQVPAVHELQQVAYHFEPPGFISGSNIPLESGLYRVSTSWLDFEHIQNAAAGLSPDAFRELSIRSLMGASQLSEFAELVDLTHVPEVVRCRFSYFDGNSWQTSWSSQQRGLPRIVKLEFDVVSASDVKELQRLLGNQQDESADSTKPIDINNETLELDPIQQIERTHYEYWVLLQPMSKPRMGDSNGYVASPTLSSVGGGL